MCIITVRKNGMTQTELDRAKKISAELEKMYPDVSLEDGVWMKQRGEEILNAAYPDLYKFVNGFLVKQKVRSPAERAKMVAQANKFAEFEATTKRDQENEEGL